VRYQLWSCRMQGDRQQPSTHIPALQDSRDAARAADACPGFYEELETMVRKLEAVAARPAKSVGVGEAAMHDPLCRGQKPPPPPA
jgi:hypothetical protein